MIRYLQGNLISYDSGSKAEVENPLLNPNETDVSKRIDLDDESFDNGEVRSNLRNRVYQDNPSLEQVPYRGDKFNKNGVYAFL